MLQTIQEISVYVHRFHNLDLFQQGWYQIRTTVRWENGERKTFGTPARVVQYEVSDLGSDSKYGIWKIDDEDNSFCTPPFRIKYARQDIHLCILVSFNLSLVAFEGPSTSAAILRFELMYAPAYENGADLQASFRSGPVAIHEFRIPPNALLGVHSYCPVQFDAFHSVLVDVSVHASLLKYSSKPPPRKVPRNSDSAYVSTGESFKPSNQDRIASKNIKDVQLLKALLTARDSLIEELQIFCKAVDQSIDLSEFMAMMDDTKVWNSLQQVAVTVELENGKQQIGFEGKIHCLSGGEVPDCFHLLGDQILYLWNIFLNFHRVNKSKLLKFLRDTWSKDRRAEWSIWMVHAKVEMPHHYINSNDSSRKALLKHGDAPAQVAGMRAELHRRSIAQMKMNNRSVQDMQIFGDPLSIPIVTVERVTNSPRRTTSTNSYLRNMHVPQSLSNDASEAEGNTSIKNNHVLKVVVFVHGFQGHHLDLRLIRNQWIVIDPKIDFLMSEANEDRTSDNFIEMGNRLAKEVVSFVKRKMDRASRSGRLGDIKISFVGHSIGNLIIRTALTDAIMEPYLRYLHTYMSLSGPHLGYLYSSNSLFNSGLWVLKKLKGTQCLHQLTLTDDPDPQNTFLYKLCKKKTLEHFNHIILLSSPQKNIAQTTVDSSSTLHVYDSNLACLWFHVVRGSDSESIFVASITIPSDLSPDQIPSGSSSMAVTRVSLLPAATAQPVDNLSTVTDYIVGNNLILRVYHKSTTLLLPYPNNPATSTLIPSSESFEDGYIPYHSARIESCPAASCDSSKRGKVFLEMLNNCLDQIRSNPSHRRVFMRCDVNFDPATYGKNLNSFIGRAAHVEFVGSDIFARFIMWSFIELFK